MVQGQAVSVTSANTCAHQGRCPRADATVTTARGLIGYQLRTGVRQARISKALTHSLTQLNSHKVGVLYHSTLYHSTA
jgi:hypothetical protein